MRDSYRLPGARPSSFRARPSGSTIHHRRIYHRYTYLALGILVSSQDPPNADLAVSAHRDALSACADAAPRGNVYARLLWASARGIWVPGSTQPSLYVSMLLDLGALTIA